MKASERLEAERELVKAKKSNLYETIAETKRPLEEAINRATEAMYAEVAVLDKKERNLTDRLEEALKAERAAEWENRAPATPEEFKNWIIHSGKSPFTDYFSVSWANPIRPKKVGQVTIFGLNDGEKYYVAFKGEKVVGHMRVHPSEHPGDNTYVRENEVNGKEVFHFKSNDWWSRSVTAPFETFVKAIEREFA